jgi:lysophospholipase L1-like esterase
MSRRILGLALAAAVALAACGGHSPTKPTPPPVDDGGGNPPPPPPPPPPTLKVTKILAFGDSITEGSVQPPATLLALDAGLPVSYPYKLQSMETERYSTQSITVWNAGKGGEACEDSGALSRLLDNISATRPDVLLLMEGANDLGLYSSLSGGAQRAGIQKAVDALEDMVRGAQARGVTVFVATITPQRASGSRGGAAALVDSYNAAVRTMASKKNATLVDVGAQFPVSMIGLDGLHPTEDGYQKLAQIFQDALTAAYEVAPASSSSSR